MGGFPDEGLVGTGPVAAGPVPAPLMPLADTPPADVHLHSTDEVRSYRIEAEDGNIGHVSGFLFDDVNWVIRYLTVDTRNWWTGGKEVLLAAEWIDEIDFVTRSVSTSLLREAIKDSPEYNGAAPPKRNYETQLYRFYGKRGYWQ